MKRTKGKWNVGMYSKDPNKYIVAKHQTICTLDQGFYENPIPDAECEANANLIAAAPDMYEALNQVLRDLEESGYADGCSFSTDQIKLALNKAQGKS